MAPRITTATAALLLCACLMSLTSSQPVAKKPVANKPIALPKFKKPVSVPTVKTRAPAMAGLGAKMIKRPAGTAAAPPAVPKNAEQYYNLNPQWGDVPFNQTAIVQLMKRVMRAIRIPDYSMLFSAFSDIRKCAYYATRSPSGCTAKRAG